MSVTLMLCYINIIIKLKRNVLVDTQGFEAEAFLKNNQKMIATHHSNTSL